MAASSGVHAGAYQGGLGRGSVISCGSLHGHHAPPTRRDRRKGSETHDQSVACPVAEALEQRCPASSRRGSATRGRPSSPRDRKRRAPSPTSSELKIGEGAAVWFPSEPRSVHRTSPAICVLELTDARCHIGAAGPTVPAPAALSPDPRVPCCSLRLGPYSLPLPNSASYLPLRVQSAVGFPILYPQPSQNVTIYPRRLAASLELESSNSFTNPESS
jgi:hypothetical protein